ncbi:MAG TPA: DUF3309 family protein [Acidobacteriaceae bacterium]|nr:DUF3309 family protein [Acidobacteriaceae bacterium]
MAMTIMFLILVLLFVSAIPKWPYSRRWGIYPCAAFGLLLLTVVILTVFNLL